MYKIAIVGHGKDKFTDESARKARELITRILSRENHPHKGKICLVSGHSPVGGIDIWAEEVAKELEIEMDIKSPRQHSWDGEYGYKARNIDIATSCDECHIILVNTLPQNYNGMRFNNCYHCAKHADASIPNHVKSGGCWTGWQAYSRNKECTWHIIKQ